MPPPITSRLSRQREIDSSSRRRKLSTPQLEESSSWSQPADSISKSTHREARRVGAAHVRELTQLAQRSRDYMKRNPSISRKIHRDPPKAGNSHGCEVNDCALARSRSLNRRELRHGTSSSSQHLPLPGRNPSPISRTSNRSLSPASTFLKTQQQRRSDSRHSRSRTNSKERHHTSQHHQDVGNSDSRLLLNDDANLAPSRLSRSTAESRERHDKDFGNGSSIKNSGSGRSPFAETKTKISAKTPPVDDERVDASIIEAVLLQIHHHHANPRQEEDKERSPLSSIKFPTPTLSEKKRTEIVAPNENKDDNVEMVSQVSRLEERSARSPSRGRSRSKNDKMERSSSSSTLTTKASSSCSGNASANTGSMPPPRPPPISSDAELFTSKSISNELMASLQYMGNKLAEAEPASAIPVVVPSKSQEWPLSPNMKIAPVTTGKRNIPPPPPVHFQEKNTATKVRPPPPAHAKGGRTSSNSTPLPLAKPKSKPPPPPFRRNATSKGTLPYNHHMSLDNAGKHIPTSYAMSANQSFSKDSTFTYSAKSSQGSHTNGVQGRHNMPPPPHRPPPHRSASMNALVPTKKYGNRESHPRTASPPTPSKGEYESFAGSARLPPPPAHPRQVRSSASDISASGNSLVYHKPTRPPPPPRRMGDQATLQDHDQSLAMDNSPSMPLINAVNNITMDHAVGPSNQSLSNASNNTPMSRVIVPIANISTTPSISNATNQPQLQKLRHRDTKNRPVKSIAYTDPYGDSGVYSGEVDDESRPHGNGKMKYDNGVFYEGNWTHGLKDETQGDASGDQLTNMTRERMLSGFTSWKGQKKKDSKGKEISDSGAFVYGMDWADLAGMSGKYTGNVNADNVPEGNGVMRYDLGLVAEGKWIKGKLNDGAGGGVGSGIVAQSVAGGMSVAPGGMSVAGGAGTVVSGLGMMSICGGGGGMMMGGYPNGMIYPQYMNTAMPMAASYYNPAGAMMAGAPVAVNYQQQPGMMMNYPPSTSAGGNANIPTNIMAGEKK